MHGLPPSDPKPEGVDVIGYGCFFDSLFELADGIVGREAGGHFCSSAHEPPNTPMHVA